MLQLGLGTVGSVFGPRLCSRWILGSSLLAILGTLPQFARADAPTYSWNDGTGSWSTVSDWTIESGTSTGTPASTVPPAASNVSITDSDSLSRTITYDGTVVPVDLSTLTIDQTGTSGATNTLQMSNGTILVDTTSIGAGGVISGYGTFNGNISLSNSGTINANQPGQALVINVPSISNSSTFESTNGGALSINNGTVNNSGGNISVSGAGSTLAINSTVVSGGTLSSDSSTYIDLTGTGTELDGYSQGVLTNSGNALVDSSSPVTLAGTIMNNGTISDTVPSGGGLSPPPMTLQIGDANTHSATLEGTGTLVMHGTSSISGVNGTESLINDTGHSIQAYSGSTTISNLAGFTNNGSINVLGPGSLTLQNVADFNNDGVITLGQTGGASLAFQNIKTFSNSGTISIPATATFSTTGQTSQTGGTTTVDGELISSQPYSLASGDLTGTGTLDANLDQTGGTFNPGGDPGLFTIDGSYDLSGAGTLDFDIGGYTPDVGFSTLDVTGSASLDGNLNLTFVNGFLPQVGDTFALLFSQSDSGIFTGTTSSDPQVSYVVDYGSNSAEVMITAVPEPGSVAMLAVGVAALLSRRRRALPS